MAPFIADSSRPLARTRTEPAGIPVRNGANTTPVGKRANSECLRPRPCPTPDPAAR